jgi:hypothetical protein
MSIGEEIAMTAQQKIEKLTHAWYGFTLFGGLASIASSVFGGLFSIVITILVAIPTMLFGFFVTWFLGRRLLARSSFTRVVLVVLSALSMILAALGTAKLGWTFLHEWSLSLLVQAVYMAACTYMNARSYNTLTDATVKSYFG